MAGAGTFTGGITLETGTLTFGVANAAANSSGLNVTGDATFNLPDWSAGSALPIAIAAGKTLTANASTGINLDAALTGTGSLTIVGSVTAGDRFILGSATGFTGAVNLQQGTLEADPFIGNTGTARNVSGINVTGDATIVGTTYGGIAVPLSVAAGKTATLKGIQAIGPGISGAGTLLVTDSTLSLSGTNSFSGNIRLAGGSLAIVGTANVASVAGLSVENNAGLALTTNDATLAAPITIAAAKTLTLSGNHALTLAGALSGDGALRVNTNGSVVFGSANTFHGGTALDAGTSFLGVNDAFGDGTLTISYGTISSDGTTARSLANNVVATADLVLGDQTKNGALTFSGSVDLGAVRSISVNAPVTLSGVVSNGGLTKTGDAMLTLSGANTFIGATQVNWGVLAVGHATGLGTDAAGTTVADGAELRVQGGITVASEAVTLNGMGFSGNGALRNFSGDNALGGAITLASDAKIVATAGKLTLTGGVTSADKNLTIGGAGDITIDTTGLNLGAGSLTMSGTGTLLLSLANTYAGGTTITTGTIKIGNVGALGAGAVSVAAAGTLDLNNLTVTNAITLASGATLTGGTLSVADAPKTGTLDVVLTGSTPLEKTDSGRLELTGDNTFTGATSVSNGGTIAVADFGNGSTASPLGVTSLADPTKLVLASGATLEFTGTTATSTARSFTVSGSAGIAAGAGAAALTFTEDAKIALSGTAPELKLIANNTGATNIFRASLSQADIDAGNGLSKLAIEGAGVWVIGGNVNRFKGDIRVDAAAGSTIALESGALPAGATLALASGAKLRWEAGNTNDLSSNLSVATGATAKLDLGTNTVVFAGLQDVTGGATLQKEGAGTLKITSAVNAPNVNVTLPANSGLLAVNGTVGNVSLGQGSTLGGAGTVGNVSAGAGSTVSPGNSPGVLSATTIVLFGNSTFEWQIQDAKELTVNPGYDKLNISGTLDLSNASSSSRITLKVVSLKGDGNGTELGNPLNFDKPGTVGLRPMVFDFATVGSLNLGANASISDVFTIDVGDFKYSDGSSSDAGLWSINWDSANHLVTVTAVPEPSTYGFGLGALALAAAAIRRRKRQAKA